jgi:hypothetical protein
VPLAALVPVIVPVRATPTLKVPKNLKGRTEPGFLSLFGRALQAAFKLAGHLSTEEQV